MDFVNGGELFFHMQKGRFRENRVKFYVAECVLALDYLHSKGVVYRDVKPENILLDAEGHIKMTDFGLSKGNLQNSNHMTTSFCGTTEYLAPEIIKDRQYSYSVDWYSLGLVMYEMLTGTNPFKAKEETPILKQMNLILTLQIKFPDTMSPLATDLCKKLLEKDVRISLSLNACCTAKKANWMHLGGRGSDKKPPVVCRN